MKRILFTGGGGAGCELICNLLKGMYEVHFADADLLSIDPSINKKYCHKIPYATAENFSSAVLELCEDLGVDILVPGVDEELAQLATLNSSILVMAPDMDFIRIALDKKATATFLANNNLPAPKTFTFEEISKVHFPCIVKPRYGRGSRGVQIINSSEQAWAYKKLSSFSDDLIILQELLLGQEYTVMMSADKDSNLIAVVPVRVEIKRGITLRAMTECNLKLIEACTAIHQAMPTKGCYNIQLMATAGGDFIPFEINPRVSTTFCLGVASGIDPIGIFLGTNNKSVFESGLSLRRHWKNFLVS